MDINDEQIGEVLGNLEKEMYPLNATEFELGSALLVVLDLLLPGAFISNEEEEQCYCDECAENLITFAADVLERWHARYDDHMEEFIGVDRHDAE